MKTGTKPMRPLRIFYASNSSPDASFASNLWRSNLYLPLLDLGHDVVEFDYDLYETFQHVLIDDPADREFIERNRPRLESDLLRQVRAAHRHRPIDVFFSYFYSACARPETIHAIRDMGILTVNWYCNGSYQFNLVEEIAPAYDWCLVPERFRLDGYRRIGARPIYCQEAANPNIYRPCGLPLEFDVTFVGQAYGERPRCIQYLHEQGIDVRVFGNGWDRVAARRQQREGTPAPDLRYGGILSDDEVIRMYSRSRINLGFSTCGDTHKTANPIKQIRLRDFEVPASGGFYMVEYMEELEEFFHIGREIVCYRDKEDLLDKIRYYLAHDNERERIRLAGMERCRRDHTWQKRFTDAFITMGLI